MKHMPARFSRRWWKLWRSGAIDRKQVFFDELAKRLAAAMITNADYFDGTLETPDAVRTGRRLEHYSRGFLDMSAYVRQQLQLNRDHYQPLYDECMVQLTGKPAWQADEEWKGLSGLSGYRGEGRC